MKKYSVFLLLLLSPYAYAKLQATGFPKTYADTTFSERIANATEGYKPFMNKSAYIELDIVPGEEIFTDHMIAQNAADTAQQEQDAKTLSTAEYCLKYPSDSAKCPQTATTTTVNTGPWTGKTIGGGVVIENNSVTGGSCYPAAKDRHMSNKILTSGRYEKISPAFEKAMITVFRKEGRCGTVKNDPCGYTCFGIGSGPKCAGVVINTREEAEDWYYSHIWQKYNIGKLPDVISSDYFLASMGSGPGTAGKQFRSFLGLPAKTSGMVDDSMVRAVNNYSGDIHNNWMDKRDAFLQAVAQKRYKGSVSRGYANAIELKRKNGCHVRPDEPLYR
jgi:surface antigen